MQSAAVAQGKLAELIDGVVFADGYAQAVAFAMLLACTENIDLDPAGAVIVVRPG